MVCGNFGLKFPGKGGETGRLGQKERKREREAAELPSAVTVISDGKQLGIDQSILPDLQFIRLHRWSVGMMGTLPVLHLCV